MKPSALIGAFIIVTLCTALASMPAGASYVLSDAHIPASPYDGLIQTTAAKYGFDPLLIKAIIAAESQFNPRCISPRAAMGLMQLEPSTARLLAVKHIFDPQENIEGGVRHFRYLMDLYSNDLEKSLAAYNAGEGPVRRFRGIPPYPETQAYVTKVIHTYSYWVGTLTSIPT